MYYYNNIHRFLFLLNLFLYTLPYYCFNLFL